MLRKAKLTLHSQLRISFWSAFATSLILTIFLYQLYEQYDSSQFLKARRAELQNTVIKIENETKNDFEIFKGKLLQLQLKSPHKLRPSEFQEVFEIVKTSQPEFPFDHKLIALRQNSLRKVLRGYRQFFKARPVPINSNKSCLAGSSLIDYIEENPVKILPARKLATAFLHKDSLHSLDLLDGVENQKFENRSFYSCIGKGLTRFHYGNFGLLGDDTREFRDFVLTNRDQSLQRMALLDLFFKENPQAGKRLGGLDVIIAGYEYARRIPLIPQSARFRRLIESTVGFDDSSYKKYTRISSDFYHWTPFYKKSDINTKKWIQILPDAISIVKISESALTESILKRLLLAGLSPVNSLSIDNKTAYSTTLRQYFQASTEDGLQSKKYLIPRTGLLLSLVLQLAIAFWIWKKRLSPALSDLNNLISQDDQELLDPQLQQYRKKLGEIHQKLDISRKEVLFRSYFSQILQKTGSGFPELLEELSYLIKDCFAIDEFRFLNDSGETQADTPDLYQFFPEEEVQHYLESQLSINFPLRYRVGPDSEVTPSLIDNCLDKICQAVLEEFGSKRNSSLQRDLEVSKEIQKFLLNDKKLIFENFHFEVKTAKGTLNSGDCANLIETENRITLFCIDPLTAPPHSTMLSHNLSNYIEGLVSLDCGMDSLKRLLIQHGELIEANFLNQCSFGIVQICKSTKQMVILLNGWMFHDTETSWKVCGLPGQVKTLEFENLSSLQISSNGYQLDQWNDDSVLLSIERTSNA